MPSSQARRAAALLISSLLVLAALASAASAAPVGYLFAVSRAAVSKGLQSFSIAPNGELTLADSQPIADHIGLGVAVARIPSGTYVYALSTLNDTTGEIDEFKLDLATGALTPIGEIALPTYACNFPSYQNQLFAFDEGAEGTAQVIAPSCHFVAEVGYFPAVERFPIDPATGTLGTPVAYTKGPLYGAVGMTLAGNELTWAWDFPQEGEPVQTNLEFFEINRETGGLEPVGAWALNYGNKPEGNQQALGLASEPGRVGYVVGPQSKEHPLQGVGAIPFGGGLPSTTGEESFVNDMAYGNEGLFGVQNGPMLQDFGKDGSASFGTVPLSGGGEAWSIFSLGEFLYTGSNGATSQLTDRTGAPVQLDANPIPAADGTGSPNPQVTGMTGFLFGEGGGGEPGGPSGGSGEPGGPGGTPGSGGAPSGPVTPGPGTPSAPLTPGLGPTKPSASINLTTAKKAKLAAGKLKLKVDCTAACVVTGKLGGDPFKPVKLPGGAPATVSLPFTAAQRKLAHAQLTKGTKPAAKLTITEPGTPPRTALIRIT
jgi:hypothetical protein